MNLKRRVANALGYDLVRLEKEHLRLENHVSNVLKRLSIDCVLDVGANEGQYAELLRRRGYRGRIVSFEPVEKTYAVLERKCRSDSLWSAHRLAIGSRSGELTIRVPTNSLLASALPLGGGAREHFGNEVDQGVEEVSVAVERLDRLFGTSLDTGPDPRVFLKLDTQGFDLEAFRGSEGCRGAILGLQSELSVIPLYEGMPDYLTALSEYRQAGFEATGFFPIYRHGGGLVLGEVDCVMVRPNCATIG